MLGRSILNSSPGPAMTRFSSTCLATIRATSRSIPNSRVWGKNDPFFLPAGTQAFKRDNPDAEVHLLDAGHFALESHGPEIAVIIRDFLAREKARPLRP